MKKNYTDFINSLKGKDIKIDRPIAAFTYMKVGGPADLFLTTYSLEELSQAIITARKYDIDFFILGGGSNILVSDKGFRGLVIKNRADKISIDRYQGKFDKKSISIKRAGVRAESGALTNLLVRKTIESGLAGLEHFLGVPGTVGGAIYNNSHFQKELIGNFVDSVKVLDENGKQKTYTHDQMGFSYDYSILQKTKEPILSATFSLEGGKAEELWKKAEEYAKYRSDTQPLNLPSSGCIFKNLEPQKPSYGKAGQRVSAGYLIDKAGMKGKKAGGAMVSPKHASFIVNTGGATCKDILKLIDTVKQKVKHKFGVDLEMEVFKVGDFD